MPRGGRARTRNRGRPLTGSDPTGKYGRVMGDRFGSSLSRR
jgi:hypothetical protein